MEALRTLDKQANEKDAACYRRVLRRSRLKHDPRPGPRLACTRFG